MKSISAVAKNLIKPKFIYNHLSKRYFNEISSSTLIDPAMGLSQDEKQLQEVAYNFALKELRPNMRKWDQEKHFPVEEMRKAAQLGFGAMYCDEKYGGTGLNRLQTSLIIEALSQGDIGTSAFISIHNMCGRMLTEFGTEEQIKRLFPGMITMDKIASYCLTEPSSGSDAASLRTTATKQGDYYVINGTKSFISGAGTSDYYFVMVRTGEDGPKGISCIIVEKGTEGLSFGQNEKKMGWNCQPTRQVIFEDCKVPAKNLLIKQGQGFQVAMKTLNGGRINIASCSLGGAQFALEEAIKYVNERKQFNKKISEFQNTQFQLAKMSTELLCSRLAVREAARSYDKSIESNQPNDLVPSMNAAAKFIATEKCYSVIDGCLQLLGGYGYLQDYLIEQLLRDTRVNRILEGTNEIMLSIISRKYMK